MASGWLGRVFGWQMGVLLLVGGAAAGSARAADLDHTAWGLPFAVADGLADVELPRRLGGDDGADQARRLRDLYGYDASPISGGDALQADELRLILATMDDLPAGLVAGLPRGNRRLVFDRRLERYVDASAALTGTTVTAISGPGRIGIRLGEAWRRLSPSARRATIVHEVAHDFARQLARRKDWTANWRRAMRKDEQLAAMRGRHTGSVSQYAATHFDEDFAESVTAYVYAPRLLRQRAPHRRHLLDLMFQPSPDAARPRNSVSVAASPPAAPIAAAMM